MKEVDFIVVGCGLAGIMFCEQLIQNKKSFVVFDDGSQKSSLVAGGLYNPVILKRFTPVWKSKEQLALALPRYKTLEALLNVKLDYKIPVLRLFSSVEEQNNWFTASDKPTLSEFLKPEILELHNPAIKSEFGFGEVLDTGRIDTNALIDNFKEYLSAKNCLIEESFDHTRLHMANAKVSYGDYNAKQLVYAEGFGLKKNPYFKHLPLTGTKGELLIIKAPELKIDFVLKSGAFIIPLRDHHYIVGATYEWEDKSNTPTLAAKVELENKLNNFINCNYKIIEQVAGMRPTVTDRRPLVGQHPKYKNLYVLNGLGTRGVMIAPYVANQLYKYIENGTPIDQEVSISRFDD